MELEGKTVKELRDTLRGLGCTVTGNKNELIDRIREKYEEQGLPLEDGSDESDQDDFSEHLERVFQAGDMSAVREECPDMQNEEEEFDYNDLLWMGTQLRDRTLLPLHLYKDPLCVLFIEYIERNYTLQFERPDASQLQIQIDSLDVLNNKRAPGTQKVYMTVGCLFLIYTCFFTNNVLNNPSGPLFTWKNCADFLRDYVNMPKRRTARGVAGLTVPSMGMLNRCAMVFNGMFRREREIFKTHLGEQSFVGKDEFFIVPIEKAKPAVSHNQNWRETYKAHSNRIRKNQRGNGLPNSEVVKAALRTTDDECYAVALNLLGQGGLKNVRNATVIATNLVAVSRTGDVTGACYKDVRHLAFTCGTQDIADLYSPTPAAASGTSSSRLLSPFLKRREMRQKRREWRDASPFSLHSLSPRSPRGDEVRRVERVEPLLPLPPFPRTHTHRHTHTHGERREWRLHSPMPFLRERRGRAGSCLSGSIFFLSHSKTAVAPPVRRSLLTFLQSVVV